MTASALRSGRARRGQAGGQAGAAPVAGRSLVVTGAVAAAAAAGVGLAVLTVPVVAGWIAAPHAGSGLASALRAVAAFWLVAHHVGITVRGAGRIGMLPLGLVLLPGALLWQAGRWVARFRAITTLGQAGLTALAVAAPYGIISGLLAVAARSPLAAPSLPQATLAGFAVAAVAASLGAARTLAPWARLGGFLPVRARAVLAGAGAAVALLTTAAAILIAVSLAAHVRQYSAISSGLAPGRVGSALLLAAELGYLPNAVLWAVSYTLGCGFAVGAGTIVTPTGSVLGALPRFPLLAALPPGSRHGLPVLLAVLVLALPYLAGALGGLLCARASPTPTLEAAPMWGSCCGLVSGAAFGLLALFAGGPLGDGRLAAIGPSPWQVAALTTLEVGVAAAVTAGLANWRLVRRRGPAPERRSATAPGHRPGAGQGRPGENMIYLNRWGTGKDDPAPSRRGPASLP